MNDLVLVIDFYVDFIVSLFVNCVLCFVLSLRFVYFEGPCKDGHGKLA